MKEQSNQHKSISYQFYATLLDSYQSYLNSDVIWQRYWGNSTKDDVLTPEEFADKCRQDVIDRINRVPFTSEAADQGTCFNEIIDCLILNRNTERKDMVLKSDKEKGVCMATLRDVTYSFPTDICRYYANLYNGSTPQVLTEATINTKYGIVRLYGYIDELMPFGVHDIKTTKNYSYGNFRDHWQHHVYPYCLTQNGCKVDYFQYDILQIKRNAIGDKFSSFNEYHKYFHEESIALLTSHCESFIEFIEAHKHLITDLKIFNKQENGKTSSKTL
ncbi:MAG: HNH endonuclease [Rikenellaceae bacterium]